MADWASRRLDELAPANARQAAAQTQRALADIAERMKPLTLDETGEPIIDPLGMAKNGIADYLTEAYNTFSASHVNNLFKDNISGALSPFGERADNHAKQYYEAVRHMRTDAKRIAGNTGFSEREIQDIKQFVFLEEHDLGDESIRRFDPSFEMAQSWQRLIDGKNIQPHDLTLLYHERLERQLMSEGLPQDQAHRIASAKYNYAEEARKYYGQTN